MLRNGVFFRFYMSAIPRKFPRKINVIFIFKNAKRSEFRLRLEVIFFVFFV
jgi:hypothetical protein